MCGVLVSVYKRLKEHALELVSNVNEDENEKHCIFLINYLDVSERIYYNKRCNDGVLDCNRLVKEFNNVCAEAGNEAQKYAELSI